MATGRWGKWAIRVGVLCLACLLWLYAVTERSYTRDIHALFHVHDLPAPQPGAREILVASSAPRTVTIRVAGRGRDLLRLDSDSFVLHLHPEGVAGSVRNYRLTTGMVELRENLDLIVERVVDPREVEIALDHRVELTLPVRNRVEVDTAELYVLVGDVEVRPSAVLVSGPGTQMRSMTVVETESILLTGVDEDVDRLVELVLPDAVQAEVEPRQVRLTASVQLLAQDELRRISVRVINAPERRFRTEPQDVRVTVKGGIDIIAGIAPDRDVILFVDASRHREGLLAIQYEEPVLFEIVGITPSSVVLVER